MDHFYAIIMAGGGGTRLWPLSRRAQPKQMLSLFEERSLFQSAIQRLAAIFPPERVLVVTIADQAVGLQAQAPQIPSENFLIEPQPRGTASVVGLGAAALRRRDPQAIMAVLTADHFIADEAMFQRLLVAAHDAARAGHLVTLGIQPSFASTGFGYIQSGELLGKYQNIPVHRVLRFKEKPGEESARAFVAAGDHWWNSGMFFWRVDRIMAEFQRQMPELAAGLAEIEDGWDTPARQQVIGRVWQALKNETIDYGIMEYAKDVAVIPAAGLGWNDVGSWDAFFDVLPADEHGNITAGRARHLGLDTNNSLVFSNQAGRLFVTIGVDDLVVVDTGDVILVCRKDQAQRVRQAVDMLKENSPEYL